MTEIDPQRIALCDLLHGQIFRARAEECLADALEMEALGRVPRVVIDAEVSRAAHMEWVACLSEQGIVAWGSRINRCGSPDYRLEVSVEPDPDPVETQNPTPEALPACPVE